MICGLAKAAGAEPCGQMRDKKLHAVVARRTFRSQKLKKPRGSEHLLKLRCRKSVRRCGAKHMSKSKVEETEGFGALLDVWMSFCLVGTRDSAPCQKRTKRFQLQPQLHYTNYITLHYTNYNYNPNHFTLHYATLRYTTVTTLHYTALQFTTLHNATTTNTTTTATTSTTTTTLRYTSQFTVYTLE